MSHEIQTARVQAELQATPEATGRIAALIATGASVARLAEEILALHRPEAPGVGMASAVAAYTASLALADPPTLSENEGSASLSEISLVSIPGLSTLRRNGYIREVLNRARYARAAFMRGAAALRSAEVEKWRNLERAYYRAHVEAMRSRESARKDIDAAAREHGPILGWGGVLDATTTLDCREAIGKNFDVRTPPGRGLPGTIHRFCRCFPVAPHAGADLIQ